MHSHLLIVQFNSYFALHSIPLFMKVLFVCLGNICRSPMAEAVFNKLVRERKLTDKYTSDSVGTAGYHIGELPDFRTRKICDENQTPIQHHGRKLSKNDLDEFDLLVAMDQSNYRDILSQLGIAEADKDKVKLMRDYDDEGQGLEVPDPYYGDLNDFRHVYAILTKACNALLDELEKKG